MGYAGGLLPEKGLDVLLDACAGLQGDWTLTLAGSGASESRLRMQAQGLGILDRTEFRGRLASRDMPAFYRSLNVLVLPSLSTAGWQEQFGRVLTEAMACEVPVVVSDSGESRHTAGEAGLVYSGTGHRCPPVPSGAVAGGPGIVPPPGPGRPSAG